MPKRKRLREWVARYGIAECVGIVTALLGSLAVRAVTHNTVAAAYGGVIGENVGFYGVIFLRELRAASRVARLDRAAALRTSLGLLAEFGPAELLDSLVLRPAAMALGARLLGPEWGIVAGKFAADVTFYIPAIIVYEWRRPSRTK